VAALGAGLFSEENRVMPRTVRSLLGRFPSLDTRSLVAARDATARFWPKHTSVVLGPDDYAVEMNRVVLGHVAVTFVACSSRIRVVSAAPATEYALYVPFEGDIHLVADGVDLTASAERPLLRGPTRTFVFEPSPIRCLVIDIPAALLAATAGAETPLQRHASIAAAQATSLVRLAVQLAKAADRSRTLVALQRFSARDRLARLSDAVRRLEAEVVGLLARAASAAPGEGVGCDVESLKHWLASQAHRRVRIAELATLAGVSRRTVERAFLRTGCTPVDYLRRVRLDRACTMLAGPTKDLSVAGVASAVGYTHLGRFAEEYRRHVGELPSRTLARRSARGRD
jgi:AraC-like DNA-binding protein